MDEGLVDQGYDLGLSDEPDFDQGYELGLRIGL